MASTTFLYIVTKQLTGHVVVYLYYHWLRAHCTLHVTYMDLGGCCTDQLDIVGALRGTLIT